MAAKPSEERTALKVIDIFGRIDFKPNEFAYYMTRAGYVYQFILWNVVKHLMHFWAMDLERGEDKGSKKYLRQTIHAARIYEMMEEQEQFNTDDE